MNPHPAIAVVVSNTLAGIGLRSILEKAAPTADIELFASFREFEAADPERFFHFFVSAQLFVAHAPFFRAYRHKTIILSSGDPRLAGTGMHCLDVHGNEEQIVAALLRLQHSAQRLDIGLTTVISHRRNLMEKLGIRSVAGLVVYALAAGYASMDTL